MTATEVKAALERLASAKRAKGSAWFFKTGPGQYGAGDRFIGVGGLAQRKVARQFRDLPLGDVERLLASPIHEHRQTALFILVEQYRRAVRASSTSEDGLRPTSEVLPAQIVECYLRNLDRVNNWDLVDCSAPQILGAWLLRSRSASSTRGESVPTPREVPALLANLAQSKNLWYRRVAMISCGAFIRAGEFEKPLQIAELLVHDRHDLIHKAVGWMLREIGNRDRSVECAFLDRHAATMPRTMLRYAIEKFPAEERTYYLGLRLTHPSLTSEVRGPRNLRGFPGNA